MELITVVEAAEVLRISRNLAYDLVARGEMPHVRLGRIIRVPRKSLEDWIARQTVETVNGSQGLSLGVNLTTQPWESYGSNR